jgi:hypothetical protein
MSTNSGAGSQHLIVADYFAMLEKEVLGGPFSKSDHCKALVPLLSGRPDSSSCTKYRGSR